MSITRITDVISPKIFTPYVIQRTMDLSALIQSGIAVNDSEFDQLASGPNVLVNMPFWNDLTGDPEIMKDTGDTTPGKIGSSKDVARKLGLVKSFGANALAAVLSGDDPMRAIADLFADYWNRQYQKVLLKALEGVFASKSLEDKVLDISSKTNNAALIDGSSFIDAVQVMGDAKDLLTGVMLHSAVEAYLAKKELIAYVQEAGQSTRVPQFMGKQVVVDDSMPFNTTTKVATAYLFGRGAIAWGNGSHPDILETEVVRKGLSLAGEDILVNRRLAILHPRGVKWTEAAVNNTFPALTELADGDNWELVYEAKAVRIVKFTFKIA